MAAAAHLSALDLLLIALAAVAAGLVNAIAGGGSLISFPVLTAVGLPPVMANVTNTVALLPAAVVGGLQGGVLLLVSGETLFGSLVPWLILLGTGLLAVLLSDTLTRLNGLKQALALAVNLAAALLFLGSDQLHWGAALGLAVALVFFLR